MAFKVTRNNKKDSKFPKTDEEWGTLVDDLTNFAVRARQSWEFQWAVNAAFYAGFQHLAYNPLTYHIYKEVENESYVINKIAPFIESRVANLSKSKPTLTVLPENNDPLTIQSAKLSTDLLKHSWKVQDNDAKFVDSMFWMTITGSVFWKTVWDAEGGDAILADDNEKGELTFGEDGRKESNVVFLGRNKTILKDPFAIVVPNNTRDLQQAPWLIDRTYMHIDDVEAKYGLKREDIEGYGNEMSSYEKFLSELNSPIFSSFNGFGIGSSQLSAGPENFDIALVKEMWLKPTPEFPKGIVATAIGTNLIDMKNWPDELLKFHDGSPMFPYCHMQEYRNPWGFYGYSSVTRLLPVQKHYNQYRTQLAVNGELMANVKWHAYKGSGLSEDSLTDESGEVVETNPNVGRPQQLAVAPLPNYVIESGRQDIQDFRDVGGEKDASQMPFQGITAGVALETASEITNLPLIPIMTNIHKALVQHGRLELIYANKHYTDERIIKLVENDGSVIITKFKETDLNNQLDVRIAIDTSLSDSKAANQQKLIDLWDRRVITDPDLFLRAFTAGRVDIVTSKKDPTIDVIIEQIDDIKNGKQPMVSQFDNHILHFKMLSEFVQSPEFRRMPPDRQQIASMTIQQHLGYLGQGGAQGNGPEQNQAAVGTPFGSQVPVGMPPAGA